MDWTVEVSRGVVQFKGQDSWIWYSHVPLLALQSPMFGNAVAGNSTAIGLNAHAPIELFMVNSS